MSTMLCRLCTSVLSPLLCCNRVERDVGGGAGRDQFSVSRASLEPLGPLHGKVDASMAFYSEAGVT